MFKGFDLFKGEDVKSFYNCLVHFDTISNTSDYRYEEYFTNLTKIQRQTVVAIASRMAQNAVFHSFINKFLVAEKYDHAWLNLPALQHLRKYGQIFFDGPGESIESKMVHEYVLDKLYRENNCIPAWWEGVKEKMQQQKAPRTKASKGKKNAKKAAAPKSKPELTLDTLPNFQKPKALTRTEVLDDISHWRPLRQEDMRLTPKKGKKTTTKTKSRAMSCKQWRIFYATGIMPVTKPVSRQKARQTIEVDELPVDLSLSVEMNAESKPASTSVTPNKARTIAAAAAVAPAVSEYNLRKRKSPVSDEGYFSGNAAQTLPEKKRKTSNETETSSSAPSTPEETDAIVENIMGTLAKLRTPKVLPSPAWAEWNGLEEVVC